MSYCRYAKLRGCIIWGNTAESAEPQVHESSVPPFSCIQDCIGGGEGNISQDPVFVDFDGPDNDPGTDEDNDYHLSAYSPCIDAGKNQPWMETGTDIEGNPRIVHGFSSATVDMGAYEYPTMAFKVVGMASSGPGTLELSWISRPGQTYVIFSCLELLAGRWKLMATVQSSSRMTFWTDVAATSRQKFYRIEMK